ncbi:MAG: hypothetical protein ACXWWU_05510, partial [Candidatus Limnocylindria bacterium]
CHRVVRQRLVGRALQEEKPAGVDLRHSRDRDCALPRVADNDPEPVGIARNAPQLLRVSTPPRGNGQTTMELQARGQSQQRVSSGVYRHLPALALGGAAAFWAATFATSLTSLAADYRAALSIAWLPMVLVESSLAGLVIGSFVSGFLIRRFDRIPTQTPILKAEILSVMALVIGVLVAGVGSSQLEPNEALHYFLIGTLLNVPRFLALGLVIGYLYERLYVSTPDGRKK